MAMTRDSGYMPHDLMVAANLATTSMIFASPEQEEKRRRDLLRDYGADTPLFDYETPRESASVYGQHRLNLIEHGMRYDSAPDHKEIMIGDLTPDCRGSTGELDRGLVYNEVRDRIKYKDFQHGGASGTIGSSGIWDINIQQRIKAMAPEQRQRVKVFATSIDNNILGGSRIQVKPNTQAGNDRVSLGGVPADVTGDNTYRNKNTILSNNFDTGVIATASHTFLEGPHGYYNNKRIMTPSDYTNAGAYVESTDIRIAMQQSREQSSRAANLLQNIKKLQDAGFRGVIDLSVFDGAFNDDQRAMSSVRRATPDFRTSVGNDSDLAEYTQDLDDSTHAQITDLAKNISAMRANMKFQQKSALDNNAMSRNSHALASAADATNVHRRGEAAYSQTTNIGNAQMKLARVNGLAGALKSVTTGSVHKLGRETCETSAAKQASVRQGHFRKDPTVRNSMAAPSILLLQKPGTAKTFGTADTLYRENECSRATIGAGIHGNKRTVRAYVDTDDATTNNVSETVARR